MTSSLFSAFETPIPPCEQIPPESIALAEKNE